MSGNMTATTDSAGPMAGFIGLGSMGAAMARNLARAGLLSSVWNRSAPVAEALCRVLGVAQADSPSGLAATADVILVCVSAGADVLAIVDALLEVFDGLMQE